MIQNYADIVAQAKLAGPVKVAVAAAEDSDVILAVSRAYDEGIITPILIGNCIKIKRILSDLAIDSSKFECIDIDDPKIACDIAVKMVASGEAKTLMKGYVDTGVVIRSMFNKENGLKSDTFASHVGLIFSRKYNKFYIITDAALNIAPNLSQKAQIINNAVTVAHAIDIQMPKVACVCAVEKVSEKMPATVDAAQLVGMNERGEITGCIVGGPFGFDNAISVESAKHKGIDNPVAGKADILLMHCIEAANALLKGLEFFADCDKGGIIMGGRVPIILTSRASSADAKLNSIALGVLVAARITQ